MVGLEWLETDFISLHPVLLALDDNSGRTHAIWGLSAVE